MEATVNMRVSKHVSGQGNVVQGVIRDERGRVTVHSTLVGEDFPKHLQVAFGRAVFRLLYGFRLPGRVIGAHGLTSGLVYLRDLPLNLDHLASLGFESARLAYRRECERIGVDWRERA